MKTFRINQEIKAQKVRLISAEGENLGIFSFEEALKYTKERNLDLIEVSVNGEISVCRAEKLGKFLYKKEKQERAQRKKQKFGKIKEVRISPRISDHDLQTKENQIKKFLELGHRVKIELFLRGREKALSSFGKEKLEKLLKKLKEEMKIQMEGQIKNTPRGMEAIIAKK